MLPEDMPRCVCGKHDWESGGGSFGSTVQHAHEARKISLANAKPDDPGRKKILLDSANDAIIKAAGEGVRSCSISVADERDRDILTSELTSKEQPFSVVVTRWSYNGRKTCPRFELSIHW